MGFIISFVLFIMALGCYIKEKNVTAPEVMFNMVFSVVCFFSMFIFYNETIYLSNNVNYVIYLMVLIGVLTFNFGCFICPELRCKNYGNEYINKSVYWIFVLLAFVGLIISCYASIKLLMSGGKLIDIYIQSNNSVLIENDYSLPINIKRFILYISNPLYFLLVPLFIIEFFKKQNYRYLLLCLLFVFLKTLSHFGRLDLIYCLLYFSILLINKYDFKYELYNKKINYKHKILGKFIYTLVFISILFCFIFVVFVRNTNIIKTPINYFGVPLLYMQFLLENVEKLGHTYGVLSFLGLWQLIMIPVKVLGLETPEFFLLGQNYQYLIANGDYLSTAKCVYNAFSTLFFYFFVDFNWIGIIVIPFVFGCVSKYYFYKFKWNSNGKWTLGYLLISLLIIFGFIRWQFSRSDIALAFMYLPFLYNRKILYFQKKR